MDDKTLIKHLQTRIINKHADIKYLLSKLIRLRKEIDKTIKQFEEGTAKSRPK